MGISDSPRDPTGQLLLCRVQFIYLDLLINAVGGVSQRFLLQDQSNLCGQDMKIVNRKCSTDAEMVT